MQTPAPDTKQMAFAVQTLTHANTPQYKSSIVIFPFSVENVSQLHLPKLWQAALLQRCEHRDPVEVIWQQQRALLWRAQDQAQRYNPNIFGLLIPLYTISYLAA